MSKEQNNFSSFVIVGLGLIGGSIAKDLRTKYPAALLSSRLTLINSRLMTRCSLVSLIKG